MINHLPNWQVYIVPEIYFLLGILKIKLQITCGLQNRFSGLSIQIMHLSSFFRSNLE